MRVKISTLFGFLVVVSIILGACAPSEVVKTVVVTEIVEGEVIEKVITATPEPEEPSVQLKPVSMRLGWVKQAEYIGPYVALDKGWFEEVGLDVTIFPGGPEIRPAGLVAAGEDFAFSAFAEVILPQSNGVPLVWLYTFIQEGWMRYITKKAVTGIEDWQDVPGHTVSLWFGGSEHEFFWCLYQLGIDYEDVLAEPQHLGMSPFLVDAIDVATVTTYNELNEVYAHGVKEEELTILDPNSVGCAWTGYGLFTRQSLIENDPQLVQDFVTQSARGWQYANDHPDEAIDILMKFCPECDRDHQTAMMTEVQRLMTTGAAVEFGLGYTDIDAYQYVIDALEYLELMGPEPVNVEDAVNTEFWENVPAEYKTH